MREKDAARSSAPTHGADSANAPSPPQPTAPLTARSTPGWGCRPFANLVVNSPAGQSLDSIDQSLVDVYVAKTGMSPSDVYDMMVNETWINAKEAVEKGFADDIMFDTAPAVTNSVLPLTADMIHRVKVLMAKANSQKNKPTESQPKDDGKKTIDPKLALLLGIKNKEAK